MKISWKKLAVVVSITLGVLAVALSMQPRSATASNLFAVTLTPTSQSNIPTETPTTPPESPTPTSETNIPTETPTPTATSQSNLPTETPEPRQKKTATPEAAVLPSTGELPPNSPILLVAGMLAVVFLAGLSLGLGLRKGWKAIFPFSSWRRER